MQTQLVMNVEVEIWDFRHLQMKVTWKRNLQYFQDGGKLGIQFHNILNDWFDWCGGRLLSGYEKIENQLSDRSRNIKIDGSVNVQAVQDKIDYFYSMCVWGIHSFLDQKDV